ncbi:MAG: CBS domain-containing protein [Desulfosoma sp.]|uniref:CBS domain-containing protein n=1 Tax=Desulfosoma sp. TaxID=2603217 RepID=UPI00404AD427
MIVRHWMTTDVVTTAKEASIQDALKLMKRHSIRHLPVVQSDGTLVGWVTDADLRSVLIASMLEDLSVEDVMVRRPITVSPDDSLETAAQLALENRIGGLPVVDGSKLVGVITVVDMLSAFISMLGLMQSSSRLDVKLVAPNQSLDSVTRLLQDQGAEIISVCHVRPTKADEAVYSFRLKKCSMEPILGSLKEEGIEVVSAEV